MGFNPTWGEVGYNYASFESGAASLAIFKRSEQAEALGLGQSPFDPSTQDRAIMIFRSEDLDEEVETLKIRGGKMLLDPRDYENWGIRAAYLRDPAGNLIEINSPLPKEKWSDILKDEAETFER